VTTPPGPVQGARRTTEETDTRDLARGAGVNYLGYVARIGPRALFLVLAARLYGEAPFGIYTFGATIVETAAAVALFGMKRSLFKFMSEAETSGASVPAVVAHGIALALMTGLGATLAVLVGADLLAEAFRLPGAAGALRVFAVSLPMIVLSDIVLVALRYTRQMRFEVYARSLAEPMVLTGALGVLYVAGLGPTALPLAYSLSLAVAAVSVWFFAREFPLRACMSTPIHGATLKRMAGFSGPTAAYDFFAMIFDKVDIFLVSYFTAPSVVGVYGMARQLSTVTKKIRGGFDRILPPILSESIEAGDLTRADRHLAVAARWILTTQTLLVLFFVFFGEELLSVLGGGFAGGAVILALLMAGDAIQGSLGISELPFVYLRPRWNVVFGGLMLGLGIALNVWLIRKMGGEGAALAMLLTVAISNVARIGMSRWALGLGVVDLRIVKPVLASVPPVLLLAGGREILPEGVVGVLVGVPVLLLTYVGTLVLLGLEPEDQQQIRGILRK